MSKTAIFIPTYNERDNVVKLLEQLLMLKLDADIVFMDDHSPDGTGALLDQLAQKYSRIVVLHRRSKLGIGSAHQEGIAWSYKQGYSFLITMDCDFTHPPELIPEFLKYKDEYAVVLASRYVLKDSLIGWNLYRKAMTRLGHFLTTYLLGLKYDATGAFRLYCLDKIPPSLFNLVHARGYAFFFESLFVLNFNRFTIKEIPIKLTARSYGHSKMKASDAWRGLKLLIIMSLESIFDQKRFKLKVEEARP